MTLPTYRLPEGIERGARGGPEFKTLIQEAVSGKEQRVLRWTKARARYDIAYGLLASDDPAGDFRVIEALFYGHYGMEWPFRFKDWKDYEADDAWFGQGDGATTQFQLGKRYDPTYVLLGIPGPRSYFRPVYAIVGTPTIKIDGVTQVVVTDYTISDSGLVTFTSPPAGGSPAEELTWTGEFDVVVRFDTDHLSVTMNENDIVQIDSIPLREVLGEA